MVPNPEIMSQETPDNLQKYRDLVVQTVATTRLALEYSYRELESSYSALQRADELLQRNELAYIGPIQGILPPTK